MLSQPWRVRERCGNPEVAERKTDAAPDEGGHFYKSMVQFHSRFENEAAENIQLGIGHKRLCTASGDFNIGSLVNHLLLVIVDGRSSIVAVAPNPVPDRRHQSSHNKNSGSVVDVGRRGRDGRGHAKEGNGKQSPGCKAC